MKSYYCIIINHDSNHLQSNRECNIHDCQLGGKISHKFLKLLAAGAHTLVHRHIVNPIKSLAGNIQLL